MVICSTVLQAALPDFLQKVIKSSLFKNVRLIIIRGLIMLKNTLHSDFFKLAFGDGTPKRAFMTTLVVGTILTLINHGDVILEGGSLNYVKVSLTYCVPFCFTTWGALHGKRVILSEEPHLN
ncbi:MAG: nitrate/nitrite transporter NrtS [SAR324 cluster bacterium]|nr:nitrate/nitrite transporter NrtS [SAR324 cluster bacterium]